VRDLKDIVLEIGTRGRDSVDGDQRNIELISFCIIGKVGPVPELKLEFEIRSKVKDHCLFSLLRKRGMLYVM
jgi:hypothetical protein